MANAANGDTITFNLPLPATITLTTPLIAPNDITIAGPGASLLTISGGNASIILGSFGTTSIAGLTFSNGLATGSTGPAVVFNDGSLSLTGCIVSNNSATNGGGVILSGGPSLTVADCTFAGNSFTNSPGFDAAVIAQVNSGTTVTVINSTFSGNSGHTTLLTNNNATMTVANCTIRGNTVYGLLVVNGSALNLQNDIISGSSVQDCFNISGTIGVNSHNLIGDGSCSPMLSGNPMLGPLQNNGGPTPTMALLPGSPAIDAGDDSVLGPPLSLATDQRGAGFPRLSNTRVDIGAFEVQQPGPSFNACLKDNTTGNLLQWNTTTGQYRFTRCSDNFTVTGTGAVALVNGIRTLMDFSSSRRISAGFNTGQLTGNATIYLNVGPGLWQLFSIHDTNPSAVCAC